MSRELGSHSRDLKQGDIVRRVVEYRGMVVPVTAKLSRILGVSAGIIVVIGVSSLAVGLMDRVFTVGLNSLERIEPDSD